MRKSYVAFAFAAFTFAQPAAAITFPSLTTIYVGSGVSNSAEAANVGTATSFHCTNVSGVTATIRYLVLTASGAVAGSLTLNAVHGATITASTHATLTFVEGTNEIIPGLAVFQGGINIESTQSGVFCTAMIVDAATPAPNGIDLHLVRINGHPGAEE